MPKFRNLAAFLPALRELVVTYLPGDLGDALRVQYYKPRLKSLGAGVRIDVGVQMVNPEWISIGDHCWIDKYALLLAGPPDEDGRRLARIENHDFEHAEGELVIGPNCHIASHVVLNGHGGIYIGENSGVAAGARLVSLSHHYKNLLDDADAFLYSFTPQAPSAEQALISSPVVMHGNSAVGTNSVVLPGSIVGAGSWVGAMSTLRGSIPPGWIAAGSPAVPVKARAGQEGDGEG